MFLKKASSRTYDEVWSSEVPEDDKNKIITTTWNVVQKDDLRIKA